MLSKKNKSFLFFYLAFLSMSFSINTTQIVNLKTEYSESPVGIDVIHPRFSWQMQSDKNGTSQSAYQILVTDESNQVVWNTGKIKNTLSLNVKYQGEPLEPRTIYNWTVTVWDNEEKQYNANSSFETGLLNPDAKLSGWSGAKWIGGSDSDLMLYAAYLPVYKINYTIRLDSRSSSTNASFVYGANDPRLMDKNKNLFNLENTLDSSFISIELDITGLNQDELASIHIYRKGYHPQEDGRKPYKSFSIPSSIINVSNKYDSHKISLSSSLGYTHIYINGDEKKNLIGEININPLGQGGDFIAFPVLGNIGFLVPKKQKAYFSDIEILNYRSPSNIIFSENLDNNNSYEGIFHESAYLTVEDGAYSLEGDDDEAVLAIADPSRNSMPMMRTSFSTSNKEIAKARLYVTSRGIYEVYLNGKLIGEDYFNPGLTQYNKTHLYQTFDITNALVKGQNALGAILGEGWWSGGATYDGGFWNYFGDRQSLLSKLVVTYIDGDEDVIISDPSEWTYYNKGAITYSSFFQGQVYDATKETLLEGWNTVSYNDSLWSKTVEVTLMDNVYKSETGQSDMLDDYSEMLLIGQIGETVKKIKELTAISVDEVRPGVFVYDMGQNLAGIPNISLSGTMPGSKITLRFAEVKYPDLPEYEDKTDMIMLENIRAAMAQDIYITKGGNETINPRFTLHGYRYIEITGIDEALPLSAVKSDVLSSVQEVSSSYETSNPKINKLWENITWSMYSNFISIPTDCPQRNERMGWNGDISVFSRAATYLTNASQFLRRHMLAMRDIQREDGRYTDVAPLGGGFGGILWGSAGITVPWESYQQYNDLDLLIEHYESMKNYIQYLQDKNFDKETGVLVQENPGAWGNLGDWLSPEDDNNDRTLLWEAYYIYDLQLMSKIASVLDKKDDELYYKDLYLERKKFFNNTYIDSLSGKTTFAQLHNKEENEDIRYVDTQISYALPLAFDIPYEYNKNLMSARFKEAVEREREGESEKDNLPPYSLMTGFIGTAWINKALSDYGHTDVAYKLFQQTKYPSWLYSVEQGATTIWERLNSYTHTNGFGGNNRMNSFNHYSFGSISSWMYNYSLGIERDENYPGFKHFILKPEPDPAHQMTYARGHYDSMYGTIKSEWKNGSEGYTYYFEIPANTSAVVHLNASSEKMILIDNKEIGINSNAEYMGAENGKVIFKLLSGKYNIQVKE